MTPLSKDQIVAPFSPSDGHLLIKSARESITKFLESQKIVTPNGMSIDPRFDQKLGCFVTLKRDDKERSLRGCIGFPEPFYKLVRALPEAAVYAATEDPRFPSVVLSELNSLLVEVSVLTKPVRIVVENPKDIPKKIRVGVDGLIMKWSLGSGLLLPQVALEFNWNAWEFLENLSLKAGAPSNQWSTAGSNIFKFQAQVFQEVSPNGDVILSNCKK